MDNLLSVKVSFRITGDLIDPSEITKHLGLQPDKSHRKGDANEVVSKKGRIIRYSPFSSGLWSINTKLCDTCDFNSHLKNLLDHIYPLKNELNELSLRGYKMDIFCGVFAQEVDQPGFIICPENLLKIGELNISLGMDFYR